MSRLRDALRSGATSSLAVLAAGSSPVLLISATYPALQGDVAGFDPTLLGLGSTLFFGTAALCSPVLGRVADRLGPLVAARTALTGSMLVLGSLAVVRTAAIVLIILCVGGIVQALAVTTSNLMLAATSSKGSTTGAWRFGLKQSAVPVMAMFGGLALAIAGVVSWRIVFVASALLPGIYAWIIRGPGAPVAGTRARGRAKLSGAGRALGALAVVGFLAGGASAAVPVYGILTLTAVGWGPVQAGLLYSSASIANAVVRLGACVVVDRTRRRGISIIAALLGGGAVGGVLLMSGSRVIVVLGLLLVYALGWGFPGVFHYTIAKTFPHAVGSATGVIQLALGTGVSLGPVSFSLAVDAWGLSAAWGGVAVMFLIASITARAAVHRLS